MIAVTKKADVAEKKFRHPGLYVQEDEQGFGLF